MGLWSHLLGRPDSVWDMLQTESPADADGARFVVDEDAVPPQVFGLTSYEDTTAVASRIDRARAMQVPAVKRARDIIAGTIGALPIDLVGPDGSHSDGYFSMLAQPEADKPRSVTMTRTVEDVLLEGRAWWRITDFGWHNYPTRVEHLTRSRVLVDDAAKRVYVDGRQVPDSELIRFESPNDGLLVAGARAIRTCLRLDAAAANMADGVPPLDYFTPAEGADPADDDDVRALLDDWQEARRLRSTGYVPAALKYNTGGWSPKDLQLADARQQAVLEIARLTGIDPEDLGVSTTSRTYFNAFDRKQDRIQSTLMPYLVAIEGRFSMGDVTPRGYTAKFNLSALLRSDDKTRMETYEIASRIGALTGDEIRALEDRQPLTPTEKAALRPAAAAPPVSAPEPAPALHAINFDAEGVTTFDAPIAPETFAVDPETRTIKGLAVPYGTISQDGRTYSFSKGSISYADPSRIKLLIGHNWDRAVGRATTLEDTDAGLIATFKVARGPAGDEALTMAEDGVWDGLSVGLGKGMKTRLVDGVQHVTSAQLREISQTPCPAYDGARITEVAATAAHTKENHMQCSKCGVVHADGVTECRPEDVTRFEAQRGGGVDYTAIGEAIQSGLRAGFEQLQFPQRETVPAGGSLQVNEPSPYRFDGTAGEHSFVEDLRDFNSDQDARQRLETFVDEAFAVTTGNTGPLNPTQNRPDLYVPNLQFTRPLFELVSTGSIENRTPFTVPKFASAPNLVGDHTEGVEPTPGSFSATNQTVSPGPVSGKVEINREVWDQGGSPQADAIIWGEMLNAYFEAVEAKIAARLATTGTAELNLAGAVDAPLVDAMTGYYAGLQYARGGNRFTATAADQKLFTALIGAEESSGRKLLPVIGPSNAQGSTSSDFGGVAIGSQAVRAAWALAQGGNTRSYSFVPSSVWCWTTAPKKFTFEYQVKSIDMAIWGYVGTAILRDSDVKPIDYDTADV